MSIPEWVKRSKDGLIIAILVLSSTGSFALGVQAGRAQGGGVGLHDISLERVPEQPAGIGAVAAPQVQPSAATPFAAGEAPALPAPVSPGSYVASKTGTKYYLPWCGTVNRIKEENKVWFATKAEAEAAGYAPAANCKGL